VLNEGPSVDMIQKVTGRNVSVVPVREAVHQTPVPSDAVRALNAPRKDEHPPADPRGAPGQPNSEWKGSPQHPPGAAPHQPPGRDFGYPPQGSPRHDVPRHPPPPNSGNGKGPQPDSGKPKDGDKGGH